MMDFIFILFLLFFYLGLGFSMISQSHNMSHTNHISYDAVTVMVI